MAAAWIAGELIEAGIGCFGRGVDRAPVGHDVALEAPVLFEHPVVEVVVLTGPVAIDEIIGAHDRAGIGQVIDHLEGQQVGLAHGRFRNGGVDRGALAFLVVDRPVLHGRDHVLRLDAVDQPAGHAAGQQRVFAGIFEIAAIARFAGEVTPAGQEDIETGGAGFGGDHDATHFGDFRVKRGGSGQRRRQGGALHAGDAHTDRGVGLPLRGNTKARNAGDITRRALDMIGRHIGLDGRRDDIVRLFHQLFRIGIAHDEAELFIDCHGGHCGSRALVCRF